MELRFSSGRATACLDETGARSEWRATTAEIRDRDAIDADSYFAQPARFRSPAIIAEPDTLMRCALAGIMRDELQFPEIEEAGDIGAIRSMLLADPFRLVIINSRLLQEMPRQFLKSIDFAAGKCAVILLVDRTDVSTAVEWCAQGVSGIIDKRMDRATFSDAIRAVCCGGQFVRRLDERLSLNAPEAIDIAQRSKRLRDRDRDVLRLIAMGLRNRDIAAKLELGEPTVKAYVGRAFATLAICNRTKAAVYANWLIDRGLL